MTLPKFLLARIAEVEEVARAAIEDDGGEGGGMEDSFDLLTGREKWYGEEVLPRYGDAVARLIVHTAVPARVLTDCEAKRRIVEMHGRQEHECVPEDGDSIAGLYVDCPTLQYLALPYADHPDYQQEWKP